MELTPSESKVMRHLRRLRVATMETLRRDLDVSHMTVLRACKKYGYFSSVNRNAAFYTLRDIPDFDPDGLWTYRGICFSQHRTLEKTLVALVHDSPAGLTVAELEARLHTRVGNLLSRLCRRKAVARGTDGRHAVYLATDGPRQRQQRATRERQREEGVHAATAVAPVAPPRLSFPPRLEVVVVLEVLIQCIQTPRADAAAVARRLRAAGRKITAVQVQRVFDFYGLKKNGTLGVAELALRLVHEQIAEAADARRTTPTRRIHIRHAAGIVGAGRRVGVWSSLLRPRSTRCASFRRPCPRRLNAVVTFLHGVFTAQDATQIHHAFRLTDQQSGRTLERYVGNTHFGAGSL